MSLRLPLDSSRLTSYSVNHMTITELRKKLTSTEKFAIYLNVVTTCDHFIRPTGSSHLLVPKAHAKRLLKGLDGNQEAMARWDERGALIIGRFDILAVS